MAATYNSDTDAVGLYVDGVQVESGTETSGPASNTVPVRIGAWLIGSKTRNAFEGAIDQVKIFNGALSEADIMTL